MNYKQFKSAFANVLVPLGFANSARMFYRKNGDVFSIVDLQKSDWSGDYFVNIGVYVADEEELNEPPPFRYAHLKLRLGSIVSKSLNKTLGPALDLEVQMSAAERSAIITKALEEYGIPFLNSLRTIDGIADYLSPENRNFAGVTVALREIVRKRTTKDA